ncbi:MAG: xanthine dehydrogenase family protein molybdopterin-binding subunit [Alphaproteobacteria bacterium]
MNSVAKSAVGQRLPRLEANEKALGQAQYIDDMVRPRMLHGAILGSPIPHGRIVKWDKSRALALPGVKAVVLGPELPPHHAGAFIKDEMIMARDVVRYIGDPVAAVAAVDLDTARRALTLIDIEYDELPAVFDVEAAQAPDAPIIHENFDKYVKVFAADYSGRNVLSISTITEGDVDIAWKDCDVIVEGVYESQAQAHAYLEPSGAIAEFDAAGKVTIWSATQSVFKVQAAVSETMGIPMSKVRAIATRIGGGFGGKAEPGTQLIAAVLARETGRPVKVVLSRDEEFTMMRVRHPAKVRVKTGAKRDGTLVAREVEAVYDGGAYADDSPGVLGFGVLMARGPYRIPHVKCVGRAVYTNKLRTGAFRGFGNPQTAFAGEANMDDLAAELNMDPLDLRHKNAMRAGDTWVGGQKVEACGLIECIEKLRDSAQWQKRRAEAAKSARPGKKRGIGVACLAHISGVLGTSAIVRMLEDGTFALNTGAVDIGQGSDTTLAQICAGVLKVPVEHVNLVNPDTDASPYNWGTGASRVTYTVGRAVVGASNVVVDLILQRAAMILECAPADLELREGSLVGVKGVPGKVVPYQAIAGFSHYAVGGPIMGSNALMFDGPGFDPKRAVLKGVPFSNLGAYVFGVQAVEVEVDEVTGHVEVLEVWAAHDVGKAINPQSVEGQIQGGVVQAIGYALTESVEWDGGRVINPSFMDYKIPGSLDVPYQIHPIIVEHAESSGPFGAKGVGEPGLIGIAPAIRGAITHAAGVTLSVMPFSPERVWRALEGGS